MLESFLIWLLGPMMATTLVFFMAIAMGLGLFCAFVYFIAIMAEKN